MRTFPVILDSCPPYLHGNGRPASLLLAPLGTSTLIGHISSQLAGAGRGPMVLPTFDAPDGYDEAIREACPDVEAVLPAGEFAQRLAAYEPSDCLLVVDPRLLPEELAPESLLRRPVYDHRWVRHLVPLAASDGGTRECVELDADGQVRRIQRYYDDVTWPFADGVSCSILPGACAAMAPDLSFASLSDLRRSLASRGIPSRDLPVRGSVFDLSEEQGLLDLSEHLIRKRGMGAGNRARRGPLTGRHCRIHPTSRFVGPVVLQDGVTVEREATVLGPCLVGAGAVIGANATVAQCLLGPGTVVSPEVTVRHRAVFGQAEALPTPPTTAYRGPVSSSIVPISASDPPEGAGTYIEVKCVIEAVLALLALVLLSPLLLVIAALIALESPGGIFYPDERESRGGRPFRCLKFRTMFAGAEAQQRRLYANNQVDGPQFKLDHDPRVTKVGRFLRGISFDELPQLINVVRGEMAIVGPRPSPFRENQTCVPWRAGRLSVRPGITGLWQVCRHDRKAGDFHQWIYYDLLYVRHMSPLLDLKIVIATILTLGGRRPVPLRWLLDVPDGTGRS